MNLTFRSAAALALTAAAAFAMTTLAAPAPAQACGGFFCSLQAPVTQAGEHILFAVEGDDVEAHIQIQYQGPSEAFSWVLPVPTVPEFGVGSEYVFQRLRELTDPQFFIDWDNDEGCDFTTGCGYLEEADGDPTAGGGGGGGGGEVSVVAEGAVGPYDYKVVQSGDAQAMFDWLNDNGYDQPAEAAPLIESYVGQGYVFVAVKLLKDKSAGDIQPIVLKYDQEAFACIPLTLTAIAAEADMPLWVWVLSEARAVPLNYFHVQLNAKAYDWLNCGQDANGWGFWQSEQCTEKYVDLVTAAADSAAGHGFVTEFAGETAMFEEAIWQDGMFDLATLSTESDPAEFVQQLLWMGFPRTAQMQELLRDHIPKPDEDTLPDQCKSDMEFYATWNMEYCLQFMPEGWVFDPTAFAADLDEQVVQPLVRAQGLFDDFGYVTRVFSTMSPEDMTKDPLFSFNPDLPDVSHQHTVTGTATCKPGDAWSASAITLTFDDGQSVTYEGDFDSCYGQFDTDAALGGEAAAAQIQILRESGPAIVVAPEDVVTRDQELDAAYPRANASDTVRDPDRNGSGGPGTGTFGTTPPEARAETEGCQASGSSAPLWPLAAGLAFAAMWLRRRRADARG